MELRQLEYFVAVVEEESFTRAAERVRISQSGVSAQIRQLEKELGAELLDRTTRVARPTAAGEAALAHAREALQAGEAVRRAVADVQGVVRGRLRVGMVIGCSVAPLFAALAAFHTAHPAVELSLLEDNSAAMLDAVRAGRLDVALVGVADEVPPDLGSFVVVDEGLSALVPAGHALAGEGKLALAELAGRPVVCMPPGTGIRTVLDRSAAAAGVRFERVLEASAGDAVADLAARGLGVGVLATSMATGYDANARPLGGLAASALLALAWSGQTTNPALRELVGHLRAAFR